MEKVRITVGMATCGIASGAVPIYNYIKKTISDNKLKAEVKKVGCIGVCKLEPIVEIYTDKRYTYINVSQKDIEEIIESHVINNKPLKDKLIANESIVETTFYKKQTRIALNDCGTIDPEDIDEYIKKDGYKALQKAITKMTRSGIIGVIKDSGLRGRGGAGFSTGLKWELTAESQNDKKYVCCNADEGDPGAFMDRAILEGNPHSVIEAMAIAAYAIGANQGYIYVRAEYPVAVERLNIAIEQAKAKNLLGDRILGSNFNFDLSIRLGAGAFVCGEETALMTSIEGNRGEPKNKPPFPAEKGLFDRPTLLNNVETFANVCQIINKGSNWFKKIGTEKSKGTKVFALGGKISNTGLVEVPLGTPLKTIIEEIGGGIPNNKKFKAAQTGGPSGGCIPQKYIDLPMDYERLSEIGSMMGSGGLIIMDEDTCMVDIAKFFLDFTVDESCGKCFPCRLGTKRLYEMITNITKGKSVDLNELEYLCHYIKENALCGLGQSAPNPVLSTLTYFKDEYENHLKGKCDAKVCKDLLTYQIVEEKCIGCGLCKRNCPNDAIIGEAKEPHKIIEEKCIKCGTCYAKCKLNAIRRG